MQKSNIIWADCPRKVSRNGQLLPSYFYLDGFMVFGLLTPLRLVGMDSYCYLVGFWIVDRLVCTALFFFLFLSFTSFIPFLFFTFSFPFSLTFPLLLSDKLDLGLCYPHSLFVLCFLPFACIVPIQSDG